METLTTHGVTVAYAHPTPRAVTWRCADHEDPEVFHPADEATLAVAQAVCADCPARNLCLALGEMRAEYGVWGGVLLEGGKPLARVRRRGRPPRTDAGTAA